ncbi:K+ channel tetramerization domain protein, partial [Dictyocaulus viviparus]
MGQSKDDIVFCITKISDYFDIVGSSIFVLTNNTAKIILESSSKDPNDIYVRLRIGGKSFYVRRELYINERTLMHDIVESTHEQRLALVDGCDPSTGEYYMERNSRIADFIIDFFYTGSLHKPQNICIEKFKEELAYWKISQKHAFFPSLRLSTWKFLEDPQSSIPAAMFAILSVFFVFASVFGLILGSMPEFQEDPSNASAYHFMHVKTNE